MIIMMKMLITMLILNVYKPGEGGWKTMIIMMMEIIMMAIIMIKGPRQGAPLRSGP